MVGVCAFEPAFFEGLGEELHLVDVVPQAVVLPHVERSIEGAFGVGIVGAPGYPISDIGECDFVVLSHFRNN